MPPNDDHSACELWESSDREHFHGHRLRLRHRFDHHDSEHLQDYEILELLLFRSLPRQDTKPIAKALLARFGSFSDVLAAPPHLLKEIKGIGDVAARDLRLIYVATQRFTQKQIRKVDVLSCWQDLVTYCQTKMAYSEREEFRVLFLDKKNQLIADEIQQRGTVDHTPVYPREIVKRSLELSACALILLHNHPSGDPTPSEADIQITKRIIQIAQPMGIQVHDHLILGRNGYISLRYLELI